MSDDPFAATEDDREWGVRLLYSVVGFWSDAKVRVEQNINYETGQYEEPEISYTLGGEDAKVSNLESTENFVAALKDALKVARNWRKRTGKKAKTKAKQ